MKPLKRGRPPRPEGRHIVWLLSSTFKLWNDRKKASGFANNSNSEFAEALLPGFMLSFMDESRSSQRKRARSQELSAIYSPIPCKRPLFVPTPIGTSTVVTRSKAKGKDCASGRSFEVDITGSTARHSSSPGPSLGNSLVQHTTSLERAVSLNPSFASLKGNPMETMEDSEAESICSSVEGRHTSKLENFNSMMLKYASKRIAFSYDVFITRILLAALDHNFHLFRDDLKDSTGQVRYKKQYSKRSRNWKVEPLKEPKCYPHWPLLAAKILERRAKEKQSIVRPTTLPASHPKQLAPSIAMKEAPSTKDLVEARLSRFSKKFVSK